MTSATLSRSDKTRRLVLISGGVAGTAVAMAAPPARADAAEAISDVSGVITAISGIMAAAIVISLTVVGFSHATRVAKRLMSK